MNSRKTSSKTLCRLLVSALKSIMPMRVLVVSSKEQARYAEQTGVWTLNIVVPDVFRRHSRRGDEHANRSEDKTSSSPSHVAQSHSVSSLISSHSVLESPRRAKVMPGNSIL